jgi:hypothetical protein
VIVGVLAAICALAIVPSAFAAAPIDSPVPDSVIVKKDGLEWVWASACSVGDRCGFTIKVGKDGFNYATPAQWAQRPAISAFADTQICAAPYFTVQYPECNWSDPYYHDGYYYNGAYGSAPFGGLPGGDDGLTPVYHASEIWLVRGSAARRSRCAAELDVYAAKVALRTAANAAFEAAKQVERDARAAYYADRSPENAAVWNEAITNRLAANELYQAAKQAADAALAARKSCLNPPALRLSRRVAQNPITLASNQ